MKFLFIDDDVQVLGSWRRAFFSNPNAAFAECHSVEDALRAIAEHEPDVVFLDHALTEGGGEGLEIAKQVEGIKIYSTSSCLEKEAKEAYSRLGVEWVGKTDLKKLNSIITNKSKKEEKQ